MDGADMLQSNLCDALDAKANEFNAITITPFALVRLAGVHKLLCNTCGHVFQGFDPLRKLGRKPAKRDSNLLNRRRSPRFHAHLPTAISSIERTAKDGIARYSEPSKGHCEAINEYGMGLSLVGSKFAEHEITGKGTLLFVRIHLPESTIEAVVSVLNHERVGEDKKRKWLLESRFNRFRIPTKKIYLPILRSESWSNR